GLMGMQLPEAPENGKQPGDFLIRIPIKPGENVITVDYEADYRSMQLDLGDKMPFPVAAAELYVTPSSLAVDSSALKPAGVDQQDSIEKFDAQNLAVGAMLDAKLSGEAIATPRASGGELGDQGGLGAPCLLPADHLVGAGSARHQGLAGLEGPHRRESHPEATYRQSR